MILIRELATSAETVLMEEEDKKLNKTAHI